MLFKYENKKDVLAFCALAHHSPQPVINPKQQKKSRLHSFVVLWAKKIRFFYEI
jgi:hypothetical protein